MRVYGGFDSCMYGGHCCRIFVSLFAGERGKGGGDRTVRPCKTPIISTITEHISRLVLFPLLG